MSIGLDKKALGERIKARREFLKLTDERFTQAFVADQLGVSRESYVAYENGRNSLAATELPRLARTLGTTTAYFYDEEDSIDGQRMTIYEPILDELRTASYGDDLDTETVDDITEYIKMKRRQKARRRGAA